MLREHVQRHALGNGVYHIRRGGDLDIAAVPDGIAALVYAPVGGKGDDLIRGGLDRQGNALAPVDLDGAERFAARVYHAVPGLRRPGVCEDNGVVIVSRERAGVADRCPAVARAETLPVRRDGHGIARRGDGRNARAAAAREPRKCGGAENDAARQERQHGKRRSRPEHPVGNLRVLRDIEKPLIYFIQTGEPPFAVSLRVSDDQKAQAVLCPLIAPPPMGGEGFQLCGGYIGEVMRDTWRPHHNCCH